MCWKAQTYYYYTVLSLWKDRELWRENTREEDEDDDEVERRERRRRRRRRRRRIRSGGRKMRVAWNNTS